MWSDSSNLSSCSVSRAKSLSFIDILKETAFTSLDLLYCFSTLYFLNFFPTLYFLPPVCFRFSVLYFFLCLKAEGFITTDWISSLLVQAFFSFTLHPKLCFIWILQVLLMVSHFHFSSNTFWFIIWFLLWPTGYLEMCCLICTYLWVS